MVITLLGLMWVGLMPRGDNARQVEAAARELQMPAANTRLLALRRLAKLPADKSALEPLVSALTDSDPAVRLEAVKTWGIVGKSYDLAEIALLRHQARGAADPNLWKSEHYVAWTRQLLKLLTTDAQDVTPAIAREALRTIALMCKSVQYIFTHEEYLITCGTVNLDDMDTTYLEQQAEKCLVEFSKDHLARVASLLQEKNPDVVYAAVSALLRTDVKNARPVLPLLRRFFTNRRPEWRAIALDQFAKEPVAEYIKLLLPLLNDEDERVRLCAVKKIDHIDDEIQSKAVDALVAEFPGASVSLRRSIIALAAEEHERWEQAALMDADADVRADAIESLTSHDVKLPLTYLATQFAHPAPRVRGEALKAFADREEPNTSQLLMPLLNDPDATFGDAAIEVIAGIRDPRTVQPLLNALLRSEDSDKERSNAIVAMLEKIAEPVIPLVRSLLTSSNARLRIVAIRAGCKLLPGSATAIIAAALQDSDNRVRQVALREIWYQKDENTQSLILPMLNDTDGEVRLSVIGLLGGMRITAAQEPLKALLKNDKEDDDIYYAAWDALKQMNRPEVPHCGR